MFPEEKADKQDKDYRPHSSVSKSLEKQRKSKRLGDNGVRGCLLLQSVHNITSSSNSVNNKHSCHVISDIF